MNALVLGLILSCRQYPAMDTGTKAVLDTSEAMEQGPSYESALACAECHPRQYEEWRGSMHAYAARSPVFDAMALKAFRDTSGEVGTFCTGCHTQVGTAEGEPGSTTAAERSEKSLEGVTCDFCHTAVAHDGAIQNTNIINEPGPMKVGPYSSDVETEHETAQSDFIASPEFCGSCHDVRMFPGLDIEEAYTEFLASPAREEGLRCQDCHMSPTPGLPVERPMGQSAHVEGETYPDRELADHRFVGPDYSLLEDFPYPDDLQASAAQQETYEGWRETLLKNSVQIASVTAANANHQRLAVEIEVESLTPGHNVPTGFTSERQLWIQLTVTDLSGEVVATSGDLDSYGDLRDAHSWDVQSGEALEDEHLVNFQSKNILLKRDYDDDGNYIWEDGCCEEIETVFPFDGNFIEKHSLEPLEKRMLSYDIRLPTEVVYPLSVSATLRYRNLPPYLLRALQLDDYVEKLRIVDIDTETVILSSL